MLLLGTEGTLDSRLLTSFLPCVPAFAQTIKCAHERSVHLFIDSLVHPDLQSTAYLCSGMDSFSQGLCLDCKKGRCNTLGYHTRQGGQSKKSKQLFLVTRAQAPFKGECGRPQPSRYLKAQKFPRSLFLEWLPVPFQCF